MANQWFRLYAEFASDPKVQMMSEAYQRRYVMLLCLRCSNVTVTLQDDEVAFQLRISEDEWTSTKSAFLSKKLITEDNRPSSWDKRQFDSDSSAARVSRYREKKKQACNGDVTLHETKCNAVDTDTDTDTDTESDQSQKHSTQPAEEIQAKPEKRAAVAASSFDAIGFLIAEGVEEQTAADYLTLRKSKKSPATKTALAAIVREIGAARMTPQAGVEMCCLRGWAGFKAEWIDSQQARAGPQKEAKFDPVAHINRHRTSSLETANVIDITAERLA